MRRVVILGTGTGVGKTFVTVLLARALQREGAGVAAVKPVETGISSRGRALTDARRLERASRTASGSRPPAPAPHPCYAFRRAVSPHLAARAEGRRIALPTIARWLDLYHSTLHDVSFLLVEAAGGAFSPLGARTTNADLARALGPATWVLVAPDALGVLHDVRATLEALRAVARAPDHLVLCAARERDASTGTNARELARVGLPRPVATVPRGARGSDCLAPLARALLR